jgi:hypothetical protein
VTEQSIKQVLAADRLSKEEAYSKLGGIYQLLINFQSDYPATYQYLCANALDVTLADAVQAIADCVEVFS